MGRAKCLKSTMEVQKQKELLLEEKLQKTSKSGYIFSWAVN